MSYGGTAEGCRAAAHQHLDTFWFAWASFHLDTDLIGSAAQKGAP